MEWAEDGEGWDGSAMHADDNSRGQALSMLINQPVTDKQTPLERWGTAYQSRRFQSIKSILSFACILLVRCCHEIAFLSLFLGF